MTYHCGGHSTSPACVQGKSTIMIFPKLSLSLLPWRTLVTWELALVLPSFSTRQQHPVGLPLQCFVSERKFHVSIEPHNQRTQKDNKNYARKKIINSLWRPKAWGDWSWLGGKKWNWHETEMNHVFVRFCRRSRFYSVIKLSSKAAKITMLGVSKFASFIFLDLETTGLQQPIEITELSMIAVERKHILESTKTKVLPRILDKFTSCVQPAKYIECLASSMTGLSNEGLENKKSFDTEFGEMVRSFILRQPQPVCLIAHNGDNFDFKILVSRL